MTWIKAVPKQPSSIASALIEIKLALQGFQVKKQNVFDRETSLEYPRESRVELYNKQLTSINNVPSRINKAITEMGNYPNKEEKLFC